MPVDNPESDDPQNYNQALSLSLSLPVGPSGNQRDTPRMTAHKCVDNSFRNLNRSCRAGNSTQTNLNVQTHKVVSFSEQSDDVLYSIFKKLDMRAVCKIAQVCQRFRWFSEQETLWLQHASSKERLVICDKTRKRSSKEVCSIAARWRRGIYLPKILCSFRNKQMPILKMQGYQLWVSQDNTLAALPMSPEGLIHRQPAVVLTSPEQHDITCLAVEGRHLVAGDANGSLLRREGGEGLLKRQAWEPGALRSVAFVGDRIVTGCRGKTVRVGAMGEGGKVSEVHTAVYDNDREATWCVAACPGSGKFMTGSCGVDGHPLKLWDLSTMTCSHMTDESTGRPCGGVYKVDFLSEHVVLACGSDSHVCLTDLRTGRNERSWREPFGCGAYCFVTDGANALVIGTTHHGMCRLWDMRNSQRSLQVYYVTNALDRQQQLLQPRTPGHNRFSRNSTPIYGLELTSTRVVAAHHLGVAILDFDPVLGDIPAKDHSNIAC